jgi:hypothetical protein
MLIYHPAFDAYHATLRMLALLAFDKGFDVEKARILDFYLAFPSAMLSMRLPAELSQVRAMLRQQENVYRDPVSAKRTFAEIRHVQMAAFGCLAAGGLIDSEKLEAGTVQRTQKPLPGALRSALNGFIENELPVLEVLTTKVAGIPTAGPNGLKDRSGLLEYRYDPV